MWALVLLLLLFLPSAEKDGCLLSYAMSLAYFWIVECIIFGVDLMYCVGRFLRFIAPFCTPANVISVRDKEAHVVVFKLLQVLNVILCIMLPCVSIQNTISPVSSYWKWLMLIVNFIMLLPFCLLLCTLHPVTAIWSKTLPFLSFEAKCFICSLFEILVLFSCGWMFSYYDSACVFGQSMVRGFKISILWPMASPWNHLAGLSDFILIWIYSLEMCGNCPIFLPFILSAGIFIFSLWNMSCNMVFLSDLRWLLIGPNLNSACGDWWIFKYLAGFVGFPLGSNPGFPLSRACCWSGLWSGGNWWICPCPYLCCTGENLLWLNSKGNCICQYLFHLLPFLGCSVYYCWVWKCVAPLLCSYGVCPGSSLNLFFYWACCRKATFIPCPLLELWNCVANSQEFWQHLHSIEKAQDDMVFDTYLSEANPCVFSPNGLSHLVLSGMEDTVPCIITLPFHAALMLHVDLLPSHLVRFLAWLAKLRQGLSADCSLKQATLFRKLCFFSLDCNVFYVIWTTLACNKVFWMYLSGSGDDIFVICKVLPTHFIVFSIVLYAFANLYGLQFIFLSLSMVRGHKALALWPMASPRNLFFEHHFSCSVPFMVWTILLHYLELSGFLGRWKNFLFCYSTWHLLFLIPLLHFIFGLSMALLLFKGLLYYSKLQIMQLNDSVESFCTICETYLYILSL